MATPAVARRRREPSDDEHEESMLELLAAEERWEDVLTAAWTHARRALPATREQLAVLRREIQGKAGDRC